MYESKDFHAHIESNGQVINFCRVGDHHQNGASECCIRRVIEHTCTELTNAHYKWPGAINLDLWPFAVQYTVDTWNYTPRKDLIWQTLGSKFANVKLSVDAVSHRLKYYFPFGCPI